MALAVSSIETIKIHNKKIKQVISKGRKMLCLSVSPLKYGDFFYKCSSRFFFRHHWSKQDLSIISSKKNVISKHDLLRIVGIYSGKALVTGYVELFCLRG